MAYTFDAEFPDLANDAAVTWQNSPVTVDGPIASNTAKACINASSQWGLSTIQTIANGHDHFTMGFWLWRDASGAAQRFLSTQLASPGTTYYIYFAAEANGEVNCTVQGNGVFKASRTSETQTFGTWEHYIVACNISSTNTGIDIYKSGVESSYTSQNTGTLSGQVMSGNALGICSKNSNAHGGTGLEGRVARLKIGSGTAASKIITSGDALIEYNAEIAAMNAAPTGSINSITQRT